MTNEEILKKIEAMEKDIKKGEEIKVESNTNVKILRSQYEEKNNELKALGINPKKEQEDIAKIDEEMKRLLSEIESKIPSDLIKKYTSTSIETSNNTISDNAF